MDDDIDEFEQFKAMAFNQNRRGSQSMPCTPQIPSKQAFKFSRETSKSERRRRSAKRRHNLSQNKSALLSDNDMRMCNSASGDIDLTDRLSRLSMTEIWVRRLRMRRNSSSDHDDTCVSPDINMLHAEQSVYPEGYTCYHEPINMRRSNPEHSTSKSRHSVKIDHRRSLSCRDRTRTIKPREIDPDSLIRPRTSSMPSKGSVKRPDSLPVNKQSDLSPRENSVEYYIVRTFSTSKKGLINRGDSFKRRKTPIANAENEGNSVLSNASSVCSIQSSASTPPAYSVFMIGAHGVGKTSLLQQFTSSDYMANMHIDSFADTEDGTRESKMVSVLLDEEESSLFFITALDLKVKSVNCLTSFKEKVSLTIPDAYVVVYSVSDRDTLDHAVDLLQELNKGESGLAAIILVANKGDMVRSRVVEEQEGKEIAVHFNCKYIEVSAIMNLRVDELLAGIVKQIRLTEKRFRIRHSKKRKHIRAISNREGNGCIEYAARGIMGRFFKRSSPMFRSCDNLLVL